MTEKLNQGQGTGHVTVNHCVLVDVPYMWKRDSVCLRDMSAEAELW